MCEANKKLTLKELRGTSTPLFTKRGLKDVQDEPALVELYVPHGLLVSRMKILEHTKNARHFSVHPNASGPSAFSRITHQKPN